MNSQEIDNFVEKLDLAIDARLTPLVLKMIKKLESFDWEFSNKFFADFQVGFCGVGEKITKSLLKLNSAEFYTIENKPILIFLMIINVQSYDVQSYDLRYDYVLNLPYFDQHRSFIKTIR